VDASIGQRIAALDCLTTAGLREQYAEVSGEATAADNKARLRKRIA
jgi:hypothetical protein